MTLSEREAAAVSVAREFAPILGASDDQAVLIAIEEYGAAARLVSETGLPVEEGFWRLVDGLAAQNDLSIDEAAVTTVGFLMGVVVLLEEDDPGSVYSAEILAWFVDQADL